MAVDDRYCGTPEFEYAAPLEESHGKSKILSPDHSLESGTTAPDDHKCSKEKDYESEKSDV